MQLQHQHLLTLQRTWTATSSTHPTTCLYTDQPRLRDLSSLQRRTPAASSAPIKQRPMSSPVLRWCALTPNAALPRRATPGSIGLDLAAAATITVLPGKVAKIPTDISLCIPPNHYGRLASRSSLVASHNLHVCAGVIDPDYSGNVIICLLNLGKLSYLVKRGEFIAQLILESATLPLLHQVQSHPPSTRGSDGFGQASKDIPQPQNETPTSRRFIQERQSI